MAEQKYEVAIGNHDRHWIIAVRPRLSEELMTDVARHAVNGWAVEFVVPDSMQFRKYTQSSGEATVEAAEQIVTGLEAIEGVSVSYDFSVVDMQLRSSPFEEAV